MGALGSTRWNGHIKRTVVEYCPSLDTNVWMRQGDLQPGIHTWGQWTWWNDYTGRQSSQINYDINTLDASDPFVRLLYTVTSTGEQVDYDVMLTTTEPYFGGLRYWFLCSLAGCGRRVGKLYLPPRQTYFGCRHCYDLTYRSCQYSDKRLTWLKRHPEDFNRIANRIDDLSGMVLAMKFDWHNRRFKQ